jgi:hypothetical protein
MRSHSHPPLGAQPPKRKLLSPAWLDASPAEALLGATHPLVAVLHRSQTAIEQIWTVGFILVVGGVLLHAGAPFAPPLAIAAGLVEIALCCRLATLLQEKRELCLELIIGGQDRLPVGVVEREARRLEHPRQLARLADALEDVVDTAGRPLARHPSARPLFNVFVVRPVAPQLREIADLLRADAPPLRGVALVERLITDGLSPLYGANVDALDQELRRARYLLTR